MSDALKPSDFPAFYEALHDMPPFPWQTMLAERVIERGWPACIDLPTASGKTACIDVAIFALACQVDRRAAERTAPRRIFFVVDRRIVVDEAFQRALQIAERLDAAESGPLKAVADRLLRLAGDGPDAKPLIVTRMRGGLARDDGWVRSPIQPAVITSTVDQVGSRLLFRGYGRSPNVAAVDAALTGNDALIILDEAHCAVPFSQTARAVERYRGSAWATHPIQTPFRTVVMSATPPDGIDPSDIFPATLERRAALESDVLRKRIDVSKPAELSIAQTPPKPRKGDPGLRGDRVTHDVLALDAADRALKLAAAGRKRIAVMVNRVATACAIADSIRAALTDADSGEFRPDVVLMTGRMRPLDRDRLVERWQPYLKASDSPMEPVRPVIVVTTQCLEVGADFSFEALITECASLDALRQRFGRLDRLGTFGDTTAAILIRREQVRTPEQLKKLQEAGKDDDPIYGNALAETWNWLSEHATPAEGATGTSVIDMGIATTDQRLPTDMAERRALLTRLSAPVLDAPVLLPAHLDLLVQTSPRPAPDPDIAIFLHGPRRSEPDVAVVFRRDLDPSRANNGNDELGNEWVDAISLLPPTTQEAFSFPLRLVRQWLHTGSADTAALHDVEGPIQPTEDGGGERTYPIVLWRGRERSIPFPTPAQLRPGDVIVVPAAGGLPSAFAGAVHLEDGPSNLDIAEDAFRRSRCRSALRVHPAVLAPWRAHPAVKALLDWATEPGRELDRDDLVDRLRAIAEVHDDDGVHELVPGMYDEGLGEIPALPDWLTTAAAELADGCEVIVYPIGGYLLRRRDCRMQQRRPGVQTLLVTSSEHDPFADSDDLVSYSDDRIALTAHLVDAADFARAAAERTLSDELVESTIRAAKLHDVGKMDPRFQQMLQGGNELAAILEPVPLAKSPAMPTSMRARRRVWELAGLPTGFRHELVSTQLVERFGGLPEDPALRDLILHLIASHHGYCRPFAPLQRDPEPPGIELDAVRNLMGDPMPVHDETSVPADERRTWQPAHRLDSGVAERFWRSLRRYGWWGLAYLEATLRLADWAASEAAETMTREKRETPIHAGG